MNLALTYAALALIATAVNIFAQDLVIQCYSGAFAVTLSIAAGTGVGLVTKYILDKRYIFHFKAHSVTHDGRTFAIYTSMGLVTTFIFWGIELGFERLFHDKALRYTGAIIGLGTGYFTKYHLDKRYVFIKARLDGDKS